MLGQQQNKISLAQCLIVLRFQGSSMRSCHCNLHAWRSLIPWCCFFWTTFVQGHVCMMTQFSWQCRLMNSLHLKQHHVMWLTNATCWIKNEAQMEPIFCLWFHWNVFVFRWLRWSTIWNQSWQLNKTRPQELKSNQKQCMNVRSCLVSKNQLVNHQSTQVWHLCSCVCTFFKFGRELLSAAVTSWHQKRMLPATHKLKSCFGWKRNKSSPFLKKKVHIWNNESKQRLMWMWFCRWSKPENCRLQVQKGKHWTQSSVTWAEVIVQSGPMHFSPPVEH